MLAHGGVSRKVGARRDDGAVMRIGDTGFLEQLRRRKVVQWGIAYAAGAWGLLQGLEYVTTTFDWSQRIQQFATLGLLLGLPLVLVIAWYHGDRGHQRVTMPEFVLLTGLFLVGGGIFWRYAQIVDTGPDAVQAGAPQETPAPPANSIAVLPFVSLSSDPEQEYFADGIAEDLLNLLARVEGLRVISRTSAFAFKGTQADVATIADRLGVAHVLEGSVRRSGNRVRITAQLIDTRTDSHLWSATYDREMSDIFAIQDEVARNVVANLEVELAVGPLRATPVDVRAYPFYLQGRRLVELPSHANVERARVLLEKALAIDPDYPDALVQLGIVHWELMRATAHVGDVETARRHEQRSEELFERALALDPDHAGVNAALGFRMMFLGEPDKLPLAAHYFEQALESEPTNRLALGGTQELLGALGRHELAIEVGEYLALREPVAYWPHAHLSDSYLMVGRTADAVGAMRTAVALEPDVEAARWRLGMALLLNGQPAEALAEFELENPSHAYGRMGKALALHDLGHTDLAAQALEELIAFAPDWHFGLARSYAWLGDADAAFEQFELLRAQGQGASLWGMRTHAIFRKIRDDARWEPLLASVGISPERLALIDFSPRLPPEIPRRD